MAEAQVLLGDGSMGVELQKKGFSGCFEKYNISHSEVVQKIYLAYYDAGSDIVETNSFGGNRLRLNMHGFSEQVTEFNLRAAKLAKEICPKGRFVGGSIGPTGGIIEPFGELKREMVFDVFAEQVLALAEGGVDVIYIETMAALDEAEIAIRAVKEKTDLPVIATMTFEIGKAGPRTAWGNSITEIVQRLNESGADVIGANCGRGFEEMIIIIEEMRSLTNKPIIAQPNAGIPEWINGVSVYNQTPELIIPNVKLLLKSGVNILGGCCGIGPTHIKVMRKLVDAFNA